MGGLLHLVQQSGAWAGPQPAQALLAVPNVTAHLATVSVLITVLLLHQTQMNGLRCINRTAVWAKASVMTLK